MKETLRREPRLANADFHQRWVDQIIRHTDCDNQGHVNNSVFATLFNDGRVGLFRPEINGLLPQDSVYALASLHIDFLAELTYPGAARVGTSVLELGNSSLTIGQGLFAQDGSCAGTALCVLVLLGEGRRPTPWPAEARAILETLRG